MPFLLSISLLGELVTQRVRKCTLRQRYWIKYLLQRDLKGSFKLFHNKFHEANYFGAQISKTKFKMVGVKVVFLCMILSEHKKIKTLSQMEKET